MTKSILTTKPTNMMKSAQGNNNQHWVADSLQGDMHPMMNLYSQHTQVRYTPPTAGFARRAFLLLMFLVFSLGSVWGEDVKTTIWKNDGSLGQISWDGNYRFALERNNRYIPIESEVWERMKTETFYLTIVKTGSYLQIRVVDGSWGNGWTEDDISEGNELLTLISDNTYTLAVTLAGAALQNAMDNNDLLFTGGEYKIEELYFIEKKDPFVGELNRSGGKKDGKSLETNPASSTPVSLDFSSVVDINPVYARFYLTDASGELLNPESELSVSGGGVTQCDNKDLGFYVYNNGNSITLSNITVTLTVPENKYKLYNVVGVFATTMKGAEPDGGGTPLTREPDWDLQYIYSFTYPNLTVTKTTKENLTTDWRRNGMKPAVSVSNPVDEWGISWEELAVEQYVKWYVVQGDGYDELQPLVKYNGSRETGAWTINGNGYMVNSENEAVLTGLDSFSSEQWNNVWGVPTFYAPFGMDYDQAKDYHIVCDFYSNSTGNGVPNARYRFSLTESFLDELKYDDADYKGGKTVKVTNGTTSVSLALSDVTAEWGGTVNYVRVWLTNNGTMTDPNGLLTISPNMERYINTQAAYGYYLDGNNINLSNFTATLNLNSGTYGQYQVHVTLSEGNLSSIEPNYDYVYTFSFKDVPEIKLDNTILGNISDQAESIVIKLFNPQDWNGQGKSLGLENDNIWNYLDKYDTGDELAKSWYARWYVVADVNNLNDREPIASSNQALDDIWVVTHYQYNNNDSPTWPTGDWKVFDNMVWADNNAQSGGWYVREVLAYDTRFSVPNGKTVGDYSGYSIVLELTDENNEDASSGTPPEIKLRLIFKIPESDTFVSKAKEPCQKETGYKNIAKTEVNATFTLEECPYKNNAIKYARIVLCDANGKAIEYDESLLEVTYDESPAAQAGAKQKNGVYVYNNGNALVLDKINVKLKAGFGNLNKYRIKFLLSTDGMPSNSKEPSWDYEYTYWFNYIINTKEFTESVPWRRNGMMPVASTTDLNEWETSWDELSMGIHVIWYVVDANGDKQSMEKYDGCRLDSKWTIVTQDYKMVNATDAILKDKNMLASNFMASIYAPNSINEFEVAKDYKFICEIYTYNNITLQLNPQPNARYTFKIDDDFLGELDDETGIEDGEMVNLSDKGITELPLTLSKAMTEYAEIPGHGKVNYARVWLTKTDGTLVDPTDKLVIEGMTLYGEIENTDVTYGYYLYNADGISMESIQTTLKLDLACYNQYQVHVALSTDGHNYFSSHEPDYNYLYTFRFSYPVKTKYKTLKYNPYNLECKPILLKNWMEVAGDCNEGLTNLNNKLYVRWYLAELTTDNSGNTVEEPIAIPYWDGGDYKTNARMANMGMGYYKYGKDGSFNFEAGQYKQTKNNDKVPTITLPYGYDNYDNIRLICIATTKTDTYDADPWIADPDEIQVKYVYILKTEDELKTQPFVHYQGEAYRYQIDMLGIDKDSEEAKKYDYLSEGTAPAENLTWDIATNSPTAAEKSIRQKVHTVEYYYYVNTNDEEVKLMLPLQYYDGEGNDTEPKAYYRWYDYKTDKATSELNGSETALLRANGWLLNKESFEVRGELSYYPVYADKTRGFFALNISAGSKKVGDQTPVVNPCHENIGVTFNAKTAFGGGRTEEFQIACDVSRYLDGMDESFTYLVHEPTLSVRYLFHILPASEIAKKIKDGSLDNVEAKITNNEHPTDILEYEGRTVISLNGTAGKFSLRTQFNDLKYYYVSDTEYAKHIWWYAYYKDKNGYWWKLPIEDKDYLNENGKPVAKEGGGNLKRSEMYQDKYSLDDLAGTWTMLSTVPDGQLQPAPPQIGVNDRVQMVACVDPEDSRNKDKIKPIIWVELEFIDAKPMVLGTETDERTDTYMAREYSWENTLDFNNFSLLESKKPTSSYENYATVPLDFETAQYGFSYPQLYGLCATNWTTNWDGYGISPVHGDYILLKSMNMPGMSFDADWNDQGIFCNWWNSNSELPLLDITNERLNGKYVTGGENYGGFLYVDAADEARTIASLQFNASLCSNAKIYYTAYVAGMTGLNQETKDNQTPPMLRFRVTADDKDGKRVPVVTFVTGDIQEEVREDGNFNQSQWYQVYGYTTIPSELSYLMDGDHTYYVDIDNYCDNTNGADYCIDQISFYTNNATLKVKQTATKECDEEGVTLNIYVDADKIEQMAGQNIYWRIYDEDGNPVTEDMYASSSDDGSNITSGMDTSGRPYGITQVPNAMNPVEESNLGVSGYFTGKDGLEYFSLAHKNFALIDGKKYYISVYYLGVEFNADNESQWGHEGDPCSVYSPVFAPKAMYLSVADEKGESVTTVEANCSGLTAEANLEMVLNMPDETAESGFRQYSIPYDYYVGTKEEFIGNIPDKDFSLETALAHYRGRVENSSTDYKDLDYLADEYETVNQEYYTALKQAVEAGKLYLTCNSKFHLEIDVTLPIVLAIPVVNFVYYDGQLHSVCSPLSFTFGVNASEGAPQMTLGFDDVDYPEEYEKQVVRVGLEQLKMMKGTDGNSNYKLHIPVRSYNDKNQKNTSENKLYFPNDFNYLTISAVEKTTDPILKGEIGTPAVGKKFAKIEPVVANESPYVNNDRMYLSLDLSDCEIDFHEGYEYEVSTSFIDAEDVNADKPCMGDLFLVIKVVPEFVTWNSQTIGASVYNVNWNRDDNWKRSSRAELYKSEDDTQNTATTAQGDIYKNNDKMGLANVPNTYVPMKFSYVTLLENCHAPNLIEMKVENTGSNKTGGKLLSGDLATATSPKSETGKSEATDFIKYDMLVRYGKPEDGGEGCFGHRKITGKDSNGKDTWSDVGESELEGKVFDVEKFYGNICKEIYFKPGAELVHQHYLTYGKAWVEKELVANKWYLMSTPLKETYAGDMYVPANDITDYSLSEPKDVTGRQVTEAFQTIKMTNDEGALLSPYSRTKYPIYQRSWGTKFASTVYTQTADTYRSVYSANLGYTTWSGNIAEWGHTFNDVDVPYTQRSGFSIRAHKEDQTGKALIRLPKDDADYSYYDYKGDKQGGATSTFEKTVDDIGRFVTENDNADITLQISDAQQMDGYVLVGNPYVASLDMEAFFGGNTALEKAYYTYGYDEGENKYKVTTYGGTDLGIIRPLEAFFVKANGDITFTDNMMTDGNSQEPNNGSRTFALTATNSRGQSTATVAVGEEARSVETLFDSNLSDVPMVYTVADGQAVSINQVTGLDRPIAFGVTCAASDEPVAVMFSDIAQLTNGEVYVVDAVTGEQMLVGEGGTVSVQPNDYGRYFLLAGTLGIREQVDVQQGIMVSVRGRVVTVTSGEVLTAVRAVAADGKTVHQTTDGSTTTASFTLATPGVYVVNARNAAGEQQTVKVVVK